ncbi:MAG: tetratricopeptide repeat protein [Myxococcota bacterium]
MKRSSLVFLAVLVPSLALGQDVALYNRGLTAFNANDFDGAASAFYELAESTTDAELRTKAEYYLAQSFAKKGLPVTAFIYYAAILKAGSAHPYYLKAVEGLVNVQQQLDDQFLIPNLLDKNYADQWATLPLEVLARINYLIGGISQRKAKFEEARSFLEAVPKESAIYAKAQYLLGIVLIDPRFPGGPQNQLAIAAFDRVLETKGQNQVELEKTQHLALLGLGRTYYGMGQYQKAVDAYEKVPRFSTYWDQALFENGFARFQNDDFGGGLGSLQALHAPQFAGAFQPESWILKSTVYYFSCLYEEAKSALAAFDELYLPMAEKLKALTEGEEKDLDYYFNLVAAKEGSQLPKPVLNWVRSNERMLSVFKILNQIDAEKQIITGNQAWRGSKMGPDLVTYLDSYRAIFAQTAGAFAKNRLLEAHRNIKTYSDQAEIIRFETSKAEKELAEAGVDQGRMLMGKAIYRPQMPAEDWNYWKFQGEFWIDEIGYYQYTLKNGCQQAAE